MTDVLRINGTLTRVRVAIVAVVKQEVLHILSVFVALVTQHAQRMSRIILSSVTCLVLPYFATLCHKRHDFWEKILNTKCVV